VPNLAVDVNSWARSACYPRSSFYPLSDGTSTRNRRITKPCFRICSTCVSRSQAPLCLYTRRMITDHAEGTFGSLRYILGGDRPSQTTRLTLFLDLLQGRRLEFKQSKGGISLMTPRRLASTLHCLPPMLHMPCPNPMLGCSKASRGLSVPMRVAGVFTGTTISPSPWPRQ
jgi:hypothetical protein